ncbi:MAG: Ubiquinone/menaquinone biosynthesis C-methyltransferase UbiE [Chloroflexi bacterium]|nr:Ubiquinone/menaquinone biosynthesis C-methyltransferase UbiE [Chloroflexota bacterium]
MQAELEDAKGNLAANQLWAYREAERVTPFFGSAWDLTGQRVLDVGTGLGGKLPFLVNEGEAKSVVSIDIDGSKLATFQKNRVKQKPQPKNPEIIHVAVSDGAALPFPKDHFDALISINTFEHIQNLEGALAESYRVLEPGGRAFLHLPPYFSPWGAHVENWIRFPWPHLFFSEETLLNVLRRVEQEQGLSANFLPSARMDWAASRTRLPNLNRVTLRRFRKLIQETGFLIRTLNLLPVGYEALRKIPFLRSFYWLLKGGSYVPILQEVLVTKMVFVLEKKREINE